MIKYTMEKDCAGCERCHNCGREKKAPHLQDLICDRCKNSEEALYYVDGDHLCSTCVLNRYEEINEITYEEYI